MENAAPCDAAQIIDQLTVIRSATEILSDDSKLETAERRHFTALVMAAERRLETLLIPNRPPAS